MKRWSLCGSATSPVSCLSLLLAALSAGCAADPGHDPNEIIVSTVTRCTQTRAAPPLPALPFEAHRQGFFTHHPLAQLRNQGGKILDTPRLVAVFFGDDAMRPATEAMLASYGCTDEWRDAVNEYGVGDALHDRTVTLDTYPDLGPPDSGAFDAWVRERAAAGQWGDLPDNQALIFFLPEGARASTQDCDQILGYHTHFTTEEGRLIPYAVIDHCQQGSNLEALDERTHTASHELIEMTTDPFPGTIPAWKSLDVGLRAPLLRPSTSGVDDEGADYCSAFVEAVTLYPFSLAHNYSNRRARAGLSPCQEGLPLFAAVALHEQSPDHTPPPIDLSSGRARVTLDIFVEDPAASVTLDASLVVPIGEGTAVLIGLVGAHLPVHNGDQVELDLRGTLSSFAAEMLDPTRDATVQFQLCGQTSYAGYNCVPYEAPLAGLPPLEQPDPPADGGAKGAP